MKEHQAMDAKGNQIVEIFTDGACKGNPGPGGWAALLRYKGKEKVISGGEKRTTNNRMEMLAAINALETLKKPCKVTLVTDSQYLMKGMTEWLASWKRKNWKTSQGTPVKNEELWRRLETAASRHHVCWEWTYGHAGHPENELVDQAARKAIPK